MSMEVRGQCLKAIFSFYDVGLKDGCQVIRLDGCALTIEPC